MMMNSGSAEREREDDSDSLEGLSPKRVQPEQEHKARCSRSSPGSLPCGEGSDYQPPSRGDESGDFENDMMQEFDDSPTL